MARKNILFIDDDKEFHIGVKLQLSEFFKIFNEETIEAGLKAVEDNKIDLLCLDVGLNGEDGIDAIEVFRKVDPLLDIVVISGKRDSKTAVRAIKAGALDYITKPFEKDEIVAVLEKQRRGEVIKQRYEALVSDQNVQNIRDKIIFRSESMRKLLSQSDQLKGHDANVLIVGETGTGKELIARYIHQQDGPRRPFIAVNCAAIPDQLLEAELFGSEEGAYTGSSGRRIGKFELADGGDIFLDEIGALKIDLQAKILRALQEKEISRLGGNEIIKTNFRVIAATNEPLENMVGRGEFRIDLYHRVRVIQLKISPLRERIDDIDPLVNFYLDKYAIDKKRKIISQAALAKLISYYWPGNVRELGNVIHSLTILTSGQMIDESVFPSWVMNGCNEDVSQGPPNLPSVDKSVQSLRGYVELAEKNYINYILKCCEGDKSKTAKTLNMGRTTLYNKLKEHGLMKK